MTTTIKQNMLAVLNGEFPEKIPYIPRLEMWYASCKVKGTLPEQYEDSSMEDIARSEGWGIYRMTNIFMDCIDHPEELPFYGIGVYSLPEFPYELSFSSEVGIAKKMKADGKMHITYDTPLGQMTSVVMINAEMLRNGVTFPMILERPIKGFEDWDKMAFLYENLIVSPRHESLSKAQTLIGEDGIAGSAAAEPASPMHLLQKYIFSPTEFYIYYRERKKELDALADSVSNFFEQVLDVYSDSDAEVISWGSNYDRTITFAPYFEQDILPWCVKAYDRLKTDKNFILTHTDGENFSLMELLLKTKMDGFESICPYPLTRLKLHEYRQQWRDRVLIGGIPAEYLIPESTSQEKMLHYMDYLFASIAPGDRFIIGVTDGVSPLSSFDLMRRLGDCIRENSVIPLKDRIFVDIFETDSTDDKAHVGSTGKSRLGIEKTDGELNLLQHAILKGGREAAAQRVKSCLACDIDPQEILDKGMISVMNHVGDAFSRGELYIPEMLLSAQTMDLAVKELRPVLMRSGNIRKTGKVILGTVKGDLHDIGKNLVGIMMRSAGLTVIDLGVDVDAETFVEEAIRHKADMIALSALLTTTMPQMKIVIDSVAESGLKEKIKVIVGGAPVTVTFAEQIGADGYSENAGEIAALAQKIFC